MDIKNESRNGLNSQLANTGPAAANEIAGMQHSNELNSDIFDECDLSEEEEKQKQRQGGQDAAGRNQAERRMVHRDGTKSTFHDRNKSMATQPQKTQTLVFQKTGNSMRSVSPMLPHTEVNAGSSNVTKTDRMKNFNPSAFKFKKSSDGLNIEQEQFKKAFYQNRHANRDKINQQLVELTYQQVVRRLEREKKNDRTFPPEFYQNEMKWAEMLMRSKKLQKIMASYTDQIAKVLELELRDQEGKTLVSDYMNYPHSHTPLSVSPQPRNTIQLESLSHPVWMPEKAPLHTSQKDGGVKSVYSQHRRHLNELAAKNRQKKEVIQQLKAMAKEKNFAQEKLTEQVLNKMADDRIKRNKAKKSEVKGMTPFQEAIHEGLQSARSRIDSMQTLDEEFKEKLLGIEEDLIQSSKLKAGRHPGGELKHMLTKWSNQKVYTEDEMAIHAGELWKSLEEFEKDLKETEFALELENKHLRLQYRTRVDGVRAQTSMRIEALESALVEVKLRYGREREQAQMQLAEMESKIYNQHCNAQSDLNERIQHVEMALEDPKFKDLPDDKKINLLHRMVRRLQLCIRAMQNEQTQFKKTINELNFKIETNEEFNEKIQSTAQEAKEQVLYYQLTLYEMLEQTGILTNVGTDSPLSEEKRLALQEIIELNEERIRKDREQDLTFIEPNEKLKIDRLIKFVDNFHEVLLELDFRQVFSHYHSVVEVKARSVEQVQRELVKLGMLAGMRDDKQQHSSVGIDDFQSLADAEAGAAADADGNQEANERDQYEQTIIRVDGVQLKSIQRQFAMLSKSMTDGMTDLIVQQEKAEQMQILEEEPGQYSDDGQSVSLSSSGDTDSNESSSRRESKKSRRASKLSSMRSLASKSKYGMDLSKMENKTRNRDESQKKALVEKLQERQAQREIEEQKRLKQEAKLNKGKKRQAVKASTKNAETARRESTTKVDAHKSGQRTAAAKKSSSDQQPTIKLQKMSKREMNIDEGDSPQQSEGGPDKSSAHSIRIQDDKSQKKDHSKSKKKPRDASNKAKDKSSRRKGSEPRVDEDKPAGAGAGIKRSQPARNQVQRDRAGKGSSQIISKVSIGNASGQNEREFIADEAEGFQSDGNITEPLDRTRDVLEELESKVLNKYVAEIEEAEDEPPSTFKLKAGQNKDMISAFADSVGIKLKSKDDTALMMTGNLADMIDKINDLQLEYIKRHDPEPATGSKKKKKSTVKDQQYNFDDKIPLADCIQTEISVDGELKGFTIRPELAKVLMSKQQSSEDAGDLSKIYKIIRSVNYLNRIVFQPDDYVLGTKKGGFKSIERPGYSRDAKEEVVDVTDDVHDAQMDDVDSMSKNTQSVAMRLATPSDVAAGAFAGMSEVFTETVDLLKEHLAALIAKGNERSMKYEMNMHRGKTFEELMQHVIPNLHEFKPDSGDDVSSRPSTANLTFLQYLQILFRNLETKILVLPRQTQHQTMSVQELVYFGSGQDEGQPMVIPARNNVVLARPSLADQSCQTDALSSTAAGQPTSKSVLMKSPFPSISLGARAKLQSLPSVDAEDKNTQTDDQLFADYLKDRESRDTQHQLKIVNTHIEQVVGEEMTKTIATLGEFVDKVQQQSELLQQVEKENNLNALGFKDSARKRSPLLGSSLSGHQYSRTSQGMVREASNPLEQLKQIRSKVEYGTGMIQDFMNEQIQARERQQAQRKEEFAQRRKEQEAMSKKLKTNQIQLVHKFPRLGNSNPQNVQSQRNYSISVTAEVSRMPLLHNSTTKASTLVQQPFKQAHVDKKAKLMTDQSSSMARTQSKFGYKQPERPGRNRSLRPGSVGRNPPGLVATRLDYPSPTPDMVKEGNFIVNGSLESKDFGRYDTSNNTSRNNSNAFTRATGSVPRAALNASNQSTNRNLILQSNTYDGNQQWQSPLQNLTVMKSQMRMQQQWQQLKLQQQAYTTCSNQVATQQQMRVSSNQQQQDYLSTSRGGGGVGYPGSLLSTPKSINKPYTRETSHDAITDVLPSTRQHIMVDPSLSMPGVPINGSQGHDFARKTSTTMMMMARSGDLDMPRYETKTQKM